MRGEELARVSEGGFHVTPSRGHGLPGGHRAACPGATERNACTIAVRLAEVKWRETSEV